MDFFTQIFEAILNLIKNMLDSFGVDSSKVDEIFGALDKVEEEFTPAE